MRLVRPALVFVVLAGAVACHRRAPEPLPNAPTPAAEGRQAAIALLRARLERTSARVRVKLPQDAAIKLTARDEGQRFAFRCAYYEYVPASSLPWVYEARGTIDLRARMVDLESLMDAERVGE